MIIARCRPDYQLERRFNDFADLRHQERAYAQRKHEEGCTYKYYDAFMIYIVDSMVPPLLFVKLATGVDTHSKLMATLCNELISLALDDQTELRPRSECNFQCDGFQSIPFVVQRFFANKEA